MKNNLQNLINSYHDFLNFVKQYQSFDNVVYQNEDLNLFLSSNEDEFSIDLFDSSLKDINNTLFCFYKDKISLLIALYYSYLLKRKFNFLQNKLQKTSFSEQFFFSEKELKLQYKSINQLKQTLLFNSVFNSDNDDNEKHDVFALRKQLIEENNIEEVENTIEVNENDLDNVLSDKKINDNILKEYQTTLLYQHFSIFDKYLLENFHQFDNEMDKDEINQIDDIYKKILHCIIQLIDDNIIVFLRNNFNDIPMKVEQVNSKVIEEFFDFSDFE